MDIHHQIEALKRRLPRLITEADEIHGEAAAALSAIDEQVEAILKTAGILDGIRALEAQRAGISTQAKDRLTDNQRKQSETATAIKVLTEIRDARQTHPTIVAIGADPAA